MTGDAMEATSTWNGLTDRRSHPSRRKEDRVLIYQVDPVEYGRMEQKVESLNESVQQLELGVERLTVKVNELTISLASFNSQIAGGWKVVTVIAAVGLAVGGVIGTFLSSHFKP